MLYTSTVLLIQPVWCTVARAQTNDDVPGFQPPIMMICDLEPSAAEDLVSLCIFTCVGGGVWKGVISLLHLYRLFFCVLVTCLSHLHLVCLSVSHAVTLRLRLYDSVRPCDCKTCMQDMSCVLEILLFYSLPRLINYQILYQTDFMI